MALILLKRQNSIDHICKKKVVYDRFFWYTDLTLFKMTMNDMVYKEKEGKKCQRI